MDDQTSPTSPTVRLVTGCNDEFYSMELAKEGEVGVERTLLRHAPLVVASTESHDLAR